MAGGFGGKFDPKNKSNKLFTSEVFKDSPETNSAKISPPQNKFKLGGILGLGQTVEFGSKPDKSQSGGKEFMGNVNYLQQQENLLINQKQKELEQSVKQLQDELKKLASATDNLNKDVEKVAYQPVVEPSDYQISFLDRVRMFIIDFRKNISEASMWMESFNTKKRKKNYFWSTAKDKKKGGQQYMFSNEHSIARSAN